MLDDSGRTAAAWYTCVRAARPFREVRRLPPELRLPRGFVVSLTAVLAAGAAIGFASGGESLMGRVAEASFRASFFAYLLVSSLDLMEHFRLEKYVTGRYIGFTVVPFAETLVHGAIVTTLAAMITFVRPISGTPELRDWAILLSPLVFLALGWFDELFFHRRRALHREDILHTISHLAAGTMLVSMFASRLVVWD